LRTPHGEHGLTPGDVVCFPEGPDGAHAVSNAANERVRVLMLSTKRKPAAFVYPDSGKIALVTGAGGDDGIFRIADAVDYWEGEE
jgi:uncharacterized cupin superfamily protein